MRLIVGFLAGLLLTGCSSVSLKQPVKSLPVQQGEVGPVSAENPMQYPFSCSIEQAGLGEPIIDNQEKQGQPVYGRWLFFDYVKGYSQFCGTPMQVSYYYRNLEGEFVAISDKAKLPHDVQMISTGGQQVPFLVRLERGVINRFIYGLSSLSPWPLSDHDKADTTLWNRRQIMLFLGGISVGHQQSGGISLKLVGGAAHENDHFINLFNPELLQKGYLIMGSSGMGTDTTYNLPLLSQTADMLKQQAEHQYGKADFTIGVGGSGGAIQQIYNMKHKPGLLDGMVASHLFPDLLSQINGVGDCELLEYYFDRGAAQSGDRSDYWRSWSNRQKVEGFNAIQGFHSRYSVDGTGVPVMANAEVGSSVCVDGWRLVTPVVFNPKMFLPFVEQHEVWLEDNAELLMSVNWTHWDDTKEVYGEDAQGYAYRTYDNVGVQYGLEALRNGELSVERFLDLNARVGGWKHPSEMQVEFAPYYPYGALMIDKLSVSDFITGNIKLTSTGDFIRGTQNLITLFPDDKASPRIKKWFGRDDQQSVWSHHNSTASNSTSIAARSKANPKAIKAAYDAGMVFDGKWNKPAISLLVYLEDELDIHDARQSFVFRERMKQAGSDLSQFSIWGLMPSGDEEADEQQLAAMAVKAVTELDNWLSQGHKPVTAHDACWDEHYNLVAQEAQNVWNGQVLGQGGNDVSAGACTPRFPIYGNPRTAAGEPFVVNQLQCRLKSVDRALADGTYGTVVFSEAQKSYLKTVFVDGVCSY